MSHQTTQTSDKIVWSTNVDGSSSVVLVCEHASNNIPAEYEGLGLSPDDRESHAVWDPGAMALAQLISQQLDAPLIASRVSRLVYDCNRPPDAPDAMPARSELIDIPGNANLSQPEREARTNAIYRPFHSALSKLVERVAHPVIVTMHSFTPIYFGKKRSVEIGVLHDSDTRLADAMLATTTAHTDANVQRNEPYGPENGVTHTLKQHAIRGGHLNVMLEVRNDLIKTHSQQKAMAQVISGWLADAFGRTQMPGDVQCRV